jgi:AraC family transcriptional regulator, melibiose operon regulatory protein
VETAVSSIYDQDRAFGALAIRVIEPQIMTAPHWHGHAEINVISGAQMTYDFDGDAVAVPDGHVAMFWAGVPHRTIALQPAGPERPMLTNIYLPFDVFLLMPHVAELHSALLGGAVIALPASALDQRRIAQWQADLALGDSEHTALVVMELNAMLRRACAVPFNHLRRPKSKPGADRHITSANARHVVAMIRVAMEHLDRPLSNAEVTRVTGLHMNYALALFSEIMRIPLKRFVIRMRLARARSMLSESDLPVATLAARCGFGSLSQFYEAFKAAYGTTPRKARLGSAMAGGLEQSAKAD